MYKASYIIILLLLCVYCNNPQISEIPGCTNKTACNFDESANLDDGSCELAEQNYDCENNCIVDFDCAGTPCRPTHMQKPRSAGNRAPPAGYALPFPAR